MASASGAALRSSQASARASLSAVVGPADQFSSLPSQTGSPSSAPRTPPPRARQSRDDLRVARVATLVRSEVQDSHPALVRDRLAGLRLEHLLDMEVVRTAGSLLVVACDQLAEEPEREELQPDDDEQQAEGEGGGGADRLTGQLEDGEIDEQHGSDCAER